MAETEPTVPPPAVSAPATPATEGDRREPPNRLYQTAAWVAIVAGIVFIVGAVFFTGFALGRHGWDWSRHHGGTEYGPRPGMDRGGPGMMGPGMMGPGMMGPGMMGPGMTGPGMMGPEKMGPGAPTPSPTPPPRP